MIITGNIYAGLSGGGGSGLLTASEGIQAVGTDVQLGANALSKFVNIPILASPGELLIGDPVSFSGLDIFNAGATPQNISITMSGEDDADVNFYLAEFTHSAINLEVAETSGDASGSLNLNVGTADLLTEDSAGINIYEFRLDAVTNNSIELTLVNTTNSKFSRIGAIVLPLSSTQICTSYFLVEDDILNKKQGYSTAAPSAFAGSLGSGIVCVDDFDLVGEYYAADYSVQGIIVAGDRWKPDVGYLKNNANLTVGKINLLSQTTNQTVDLYIVNALVDQFVRINPTVYISSGASMVGFSLTLNYIDKGGTTRNINLSTIASPPATDALTLSPQVIYAQKSTPVSLTIAFSGTGIYDLYATCEYLGIQN